MVGCEYHHDFLFADIGIFKGDSELVDAVEAKRRSSTNKCPASPRRENTTVSHSTVLKLYFVNRFLC